MGSTAARRSRLFFALAWFTAVFSGACSPSSSGTAREVRFEQPREIRLELVGPAHVPVEREVYKTLPVPPDYGVWEVDGQKSLMEAFPGVVTSAGRKTLALTDREEKRITVRGPFEADRFNRCLLRALVRGEGALTLTALRGGEEFSEPVELALSADIDPQLLVLDLPASFMPAGATCDALRIVIEGRVGPVGIRELELLRADQSVPPPVELSLLPASFGRATGMEGSRLAWGLSEQQGLRADFVPEENRRLRLSVCLDPLAIETGGSDRARVFVRVATEEEELYEEGWVLEKAWQGLDLDLSNYAGIACQLELRLQTSSNLPAYALVERPTLVTPVEEPPTVILITSDTHRGDHLATVPRAPLLRTPTLDDLMERGVTFERAFSSSNITLPSHTALLTGRHPRDTGVISNTQGLNSSAPTLAEAFGSAGWRTVASISARHLFEWGGTAQGFERFDAPEHSQRSGRQTLTALQRDLADFTDQPLFLWLHLYDPHRPYGAPEAHAAIYESDVGEDLTGRAKEEAQLRANYRGEISYVDSLLGELMSDSRFSKAAIAFTADHGENLGEHERTFDHMMLFHQVVHVPLILAWPDVSLEWRGLRVEHNVQHLGIARTLLDLAGLTTLEFPGDNLLGQIETPSGKAEPIFAISNDGQCVSITRGGDHLILHLTASPVSEDGVQRERHRVELYDLHSDPECGRDLVGAEQAKARQLRRILVRWLKAARDTGWSDAEGGEGLGSDQVAMLQDLGYAGGGPDEGGLGVDPDCDCAWCARMK